MNIARDVQAIKRKYGTSDPFEIAAAMNYILLEAPLLRIKGFYTYCERRHVICLDDALEEGFERNFVCAHELGHSLYHTGLSAAFIMRETEFVLGKFEKEADLFAMELLMTDDMIRELFHGSLFEISKTLHISEYALQSRVAHLTEMMEI